MTRRARQVRVSLRPERRLAARARYLRTNGRHRALEARVGRRAGTTSRHAIRSARDAARKYRRFTAARGVRPRLLDGVAWNRRRNHVGAARLQCRASGCTPGHARARHQWRERRRSCRRQTRAGRPTPGHCRGSTVGAAVRVGGATQHAAHPSSSRFVGTHTRAGTRPTGPQGINA
jgi:hypothetical protein